MRGWINVASDGMGSEEELRAWVEQGVAYAESLPPK